MEKLDLYIDRAYVSGLPYVRIVHGKGSGTLREMVQRELKKNKNVSNYEMGGPTEGGDGVTIAFFNK
jgi:DNA mismatch repair protein MutS2